jgi:zinc protease
MAQPAVGSGDTDVRGARVREAVLDNGLKVLVQEVHTAPLASVWCWYRVGSRDEGPGITGVSHWVEHMNFKGTTNIPRDQVKGIIEQFGGSWNGYTWIDQTTYLETASTEALDRMLFIEAERMDKCLYDPRSANRSAPSSSRNCRAARTTPSSCSTWR